MNSFCLFNVLHTLNIRCRSFKFSALGVTPNRQFGKVVCVNIDSMLFGRENLKTFSTFFAIILLSKESEKKKKNSKITFKEGACVT